MRKVMDKGTHDRGAAEHKCVRSMAQGELSKEDFSGGPDPDNTTSQAGFPSV